MICIVKSAKQINLNWIEKCIKWTSKLQEAGILTVFIQKKSLKLYKKKKKKKKKSQSKYSTMFC